MKVAQILWNGEKFYAIFEHRSFYVLEGIDESNIFQKIMNEKITEHIGNLVLREEEVKWLPPVFRPTKIIGIGLNYLSHIKESSSNPPKNPVIFAKFPNSLIGHEGVIEWKRSVTERVDYEAELALIVGKIGKNLSADEALSVIAGYSCANDVSARDLQFGDGQWTRGKSLDTFCPLGPYLVTKDEVEDPQNLEIELLLNGEIMQKSDTSEMTFSVKEIVSFLSQSMTLLPGDVILTGTPSGVGVFRKPPVFLKDGDEVIVRIKGIGELKNYCKVHD